jgi:hypothetical protein
MLMTTMMKKNRKPILEMPKMQKSEERSRVDDTMPLCKDVGIKNSLPMQLLPTRGVAGRSANRPSGYKLQSSQLRGLRMDIFILMSDHYVWFVDCWREVW